MKCFLILRFTPGNTKMFEMVDRFLKHLLVLIGGIPLSYCGLYQDRHEHSAPDKCRLFFHRKKWYMDDQQQHMRFDFFAGAVPISISFWGIRIS